MLLHPIEQPPAWADDRIGQLDCRTLGDLLGEAGERVRHLLRELGQDTGRAVAVDDKGGVP